MKFTAATVAGALVAMPFAQVAHAQTDATAVTPADDATRDENEIVVTARRREETLQDIPLSIQAFDQTRLEQMNVKGFNDYARFAPSISFVTEGPGQSKLVIRGITESTGQSGGGGQSSAALYLDEQPITVDAANPDPRLIDIERIEVLSGPQGTLYGASSQSGTVRILTNKPDAGKAAAYLEAGFSQTDHGGTSYDVNGMVNVPLVKDTLALRVVGFRTRDAGFIDNVYGRTAGGTKDNSAFVRKDVNRTDSRGGRAQLGWDVADGWKATASFVFQDLDVAGRSDYDEDAGDLKAIRFADERYHENWKQYGLTVEGDLGFADLTLAGSYFDRKVSYLYDNTAYNFYLSSLAQQDPAYYASYDFGADPTGYLANDLYTRRYSAEARLHSKGKGPFSWVAGFYHQNSKSGYVSRSQVDDFVNTPAFQAAAAYNALAPTDVYYYQRLRYEQEEYALFGEASYALTNTLTATLGGRYYWSTNSGFIYTESPMGLEIEDSRLSAKQDGFTPKVNLSWKPKDGLLFFATYSQGVRLGGANRSRPGLAVPQQYKGDTLTNYEIGTKTTWLGGRVTLNLTAYLMDWDDIQLSVLNPNPATFYYVVANAGKARSQGVEAEVAAKLGGGFSIGASGTLMDAELREYSALLDVQKGARLPVSPRYKYALYGQYTFPVTPLGAKANLRADYSRTGASFNNLDPASALKQDGYGLLNVQAGLTADSWSFNLYVNNLTDDRAQYSVQDYYQTKRITPARPRQMGMTVSKSF